MKKITSFLLLFIGLQTLAQNDIKIGLRCKKYAGFYWENGITIEGKIPKIIPSFLVYGFNFTSSNLGTNLIRNAIPTYVAEFSAIHYWRKDHPFQPAFRLNIGYAFAHFNSTFSSLTHQSLVTSIETSLNYTVNNNIQFQISGGYNIFNGNGTTGLSTVYPFYGQIGMLYQLNN